MNNCYVTVLPLAGARIGHVSGPCDFPRDNEGIVMTIIEGKDEIYALVLMDDGTTKRCYGINSRPGIGWHCIDPTWADKIGKDIE